MAESALDIAVTIRETAVFHKRQARKHKQLARTEMEKLRKFCEANGISFQVVTAKGMDE
jgi:fructosamine-3-kinase